MALHTPQRADYLEAVRSLHAQSPLAEHLGVTLDSIEPGLVTAYLAHRSEHTQQNGYLHAGILMSLADIVCGLAAYSLMAEGENVLSVNINASLMRPARANRIRAEGRVVKAGRHLYFTEASLFTEGKEGEKLVVKANIAMMAVGQS